MNTRPLLLGSDIGGTFTDLVAFDRETGRLSFGKSLTTYSDLVCGIVDCIQAENIDLERVEWLKHGTTQVINTLLERSGERTVLVTTKGFRDVIEIGRASRPLAFQLDYQRDPVLIPAELRLEINERMSAEGDILVPIGVEALEALAAQIVAADAQAVAIAFLNSYRNPAHEAAVAAFLRDRFPDLYISCSSELSREWSEYERFSTACANAYVGPRAASYVDRLNGALTRAGFDGDLYMMGSSGGTLSVDRAKSQPLALVESGPIGGCIGAVAYARALGIEKLIAFDMGGTTAKCALVEDYSFNVEAEYDIGGYDRGFPVRVPVLDIFEVGMGGGSIAQVDAHGRLQVGPVSAGSEPGPVCFGRGGQEPTITDANLALGRIASGTFLRGALSLDTDKAAAAIDQRIAQPLGYPAEQETEHAASGILSLASSGMASAIREITVERGRDARDYVLFTFGGGGPLHGVELAREMGISQVIVPLEPGNFSALGMLFADARSEASRTLLTALTDQALIEVGSIRKVLEDSLAAQLAQEVGSDSVAFEASLELRFAGQRHAIRVSSAYSDNVEQVSQKFFRAYRTRYGYADETSGLEIVALRVVAIAVVAKPDVASLFSSRASDNPVPRSRRNAYHASVRSRRDTPVYAREDLPCGFELPGPAIIEEFGSTTVIAPGDRIRVGSYGELWINVAVERGYGQEVEVGDPITARLISHRLAAVPNVIDKNITRTAFSVLVSEYKDFAVGFVAPDGRLVCQCKGGLPVFAANALSAAVKEGLRIYGESRLRTGDLIITNTAAVMGQHLNNVVMYTPIRTLDERDELIGFMVVVMHWMDVGGYAVGSCTTTKTTDVFQEGIQLPTLKLHDQGTRVEETYRLIQANTRFPDEVLGDVQSQAAGCLMGRDMTLDIVTRFGLDAVRNSIELFWTQSETAVRKAIQALPDGTYKASSFLDDDGAGSEPVPIEVEVTVAGDAMTVDLTGLGPEITGAPWNAGYEGGAVAAVRIASKFFFGLDEPANDGAFRPIQIVCPPGTFMSAGPTAAIAGSGHNLPSVVDTILAALGKAAPDRVAAAHHGTYSAQVMVARKAQGGWIQHVESAAGGWGAAFNRDGNGPFRSMAHGDTPEVSIEVQESWGMYRIGRMQLRMDSGGAGKYRGGLGIEREYAILRPLHYSVVIERTKCAPWGMADGKPGLPAHAELIREGEPARVLRKVDCELKPGDTLHFMSAGGGGYGDPRARARSQVEIDVMRGYVSPRSALRDYGYDSEAAVSEQLPVANTST